jgi:hypothetical protein
LLLLRWLQEYPDIKVVKVECDANKGLVEQYKVCRGLPRFLKQQCSSLVQRF